MDTDTELASRIPRRDGELVLDPAGLRGRTRDDFAAILSWLGVGGRVDLNIHAYLPGDIVPERKPERYESSSKIPRDYSGLGEDAREKLSATERDESRVMSDHEYNGVRLSWEQPAGGPADLRKKAADPRRRETDAIRPALYTRVVSGLYVGRSVYLNTSLWICPPAVPAAMAHECTHLLLDLHGMQAMAGSAGSARSRLSEDEERRTDTVAVRLGLGVLMLNGAVAFREKVGIELLHNDAEAIARDHMEYCDTADLSRSEATRGMSKDAAALARDA